MEVIKDEAKHFFKKRLSADTTDQVKSTRSELSQLIESQLNTIKRHSDKYLYLETLKASTEFSLEANKEYEEKDTKHLNYAKEQSNDITNPMIVAYEESVSNHKATRYYYNVLLFAINELIEDVYPKIEPSKGPKDTITMDEKFDIASKIDELVKDFKKTHAGQEVLFNELQEIKELVNLKKKNFSEVVAGKVFGLTVDKIIDQQAASKIYNTLTEGFSHVSGLIDNAMSQ